MMLARRSLAAAASAAVMTLVLAGGYPLVAQEGARSKSQTASNPAPASTNSSQPPAKGKSGRVAPPDPTHRVPPGYSKLGLTDQQKQKLYAIQAEYYPRIQALEKQIEGLRARREAEFEKVLTAPQKQLHAQQAQQKKAAAEARKAAARGAEKP